MKNFFIFNPRKKVRDKVRKRQIAVGKFLNAIASKFHRAKFESPEYNFFVIRDALNEESLFRRAVDKYQEQIWKNGWKFSGKNSKTLKLVQKRFREMEVVTGISTHDLLERISRQLITFSNSMIVKVRNKNSTSAHAYRTFDGKLRQPVAGYFVQPMEYMQICRDESGNIEKYRLGSDAKKEWGPEDVIHVSVHKHEGYAFGTPMVVPVMDDILSLRQVEENLQILVFQHAIPLYHFVIGTDDEEGHTDEIADLNLQLEQMPTYGSLTTTNRVKIDVLGAQRESMDLEPILDYWINRVLGGFGMSSVSFGRPDTANRGTATTVVKEFQTTTAMFQRAIKHAVEFNIIREILEEGGYNYLTLKDRDKVELYIPEVDLDEQIKREVHGIYKYEHNSISESEMRVDLGMDPIDNENRQSMYIWLVRIPLALVGAGDETLADYPSLAEIYGISSKATSNLEQPANQYGRKPVKNMPKND